MTRRLALAALALLLAAATPRSESNGSLANNRPVDAGPSRPSSVHSTRTGAPHGTSRSFPRSMVALDAAVGGAGDEARTPAGGAPSFPAVALGRYEPSRNEADVAVRWQPETTQASPAPSAIIVGIASWYPARGMVAAVHSWRWGDDPYWANVCSGARCVSVLVSDYMANPRRAIDLSLGAFRQLADPSVGVLRVTVEVP